MRQVIASVLVGAIAYAVSADAIAGAVTLYVTGADLQSEFAAHTRAEQKTADLSDAIKSGDVVGYVTGVADVASIQGLICVPSDVSKKQLVAIVKRYFEQNPDKWNQPAPDLVLAALKPNFACSGSKP